MVDKVRELLETKLLSFHEPSSTMEDFFNYTRRLEKSQLDLEGLDHSDMAGLKRIEKHLE